MKRWLLPLLLLFLVNGVSCSDDDVDPDLPEYKVIELNTEDHRFEELKTIIVVSSEMPEILGITNRIGVMSNGRLAGIVNTKETNQEELLRLSAKYL